MQECINAEFNMLNARAARYRGTSVSVDSALA
jgi:hypothetical protein